MRYHFSDKLMKIISLSPLRWNLNVPSACQHCQRLLGQHHQISHNRHHVGSTRNSGLGEMRLMV